MLAVASAARSTGTSTTVSTVKDGAGNLFALVGRRSQPTSGTILADVSLWALATPSGDVGVTKPGVTATLGSGTANIAMLVQEVAGILPAADGTLGASGGTATGATGSPAYTSSASNEYLVAVYGDDGGPITWTKPAALTADPNAINTSSIADVALAYGNSTNGTEAGSWTLAGTTSEWGILLVAFKLATVVAPKGLLAAALFP